MGLNSKQGDFVALDVETATYDRASICQIGMVKAMDGAIVDEFSTLVNQPDVDEFFMDIHGIEAATLRDAPSLRHAFEAATAFVGDVDAIVTHTSFDRGCLSAAAFASRASDGLTLRKCRGAAGGGISATGCGR